MSSAAKARQPFRIRHIPFYFNVRNGDGDALVEEIEVRIVIEPDQLKTDWQRYGPNVRVAFPSGVHPVWTSRKSESLILPGTGVVLDGLVLWTAGGPLARTEDPQRPSSSSMKALGEALYHLGFITREEQRYHQKEAEKETIKKWNEVHREQLADTLRDRIRSLPFADVQKIVYDVYSDTTPGHQLEKLFQPGDLVNTVLSSSFGGIVQKVLPNGEDTLLIVRSHESKASGKFFDWPAYARHLFFPKMLKNHVVWFTPQGEQKERQIVGHQLVFHKNLRKQQRELEIAVF